MTLVIEFRGTEMEEWNKRNNIEKGYEGDFCNKVTEIVNGLVDCSDDYWDSYSAWYDRISTVDYTLNKKNIK